MQVPISSVKQVIVLRYDLHMRLGKSVAQGAHASMLFLVHRIASDDPTFTEEEILWLSRGMTKVCVRANSEEELTQIVEKARAAGLTVYTVTDAGKTEFRGVPTLTACAIGPNAAEAIDAITGELKLL